VAQTGVGAAARQALLTRPRGLCGSEIFIVTVVTTLTGGRPRPDIFAPPAIALIFLWIALSVPWLIGVANEKSRQMWVLNPFGVLDWVLIAAIAVFFALALTARASCL
jgi:hypothetical protein